MKCVYLITTGASTISDDGDGGASTSAAADADGKSVLLFTVLLLFYVMLYSLVYV